MTFLLCFSPYELTLEKNSTFWNYLNENFIFSLPVHFFMNIDNGPNADDFLTAAMGIYYPAFPWGPFVNVSKLLWRLSVGFILLSPFLSFYGCSPRWFLLMQLSEERREAVLLGRIRTLVACLLIVEKPSR